MNFLYQQLDSVSKMGFLKKEMPDFLTGNLNSNFEIREYQKEAFARFFHCYNNEFENKKYPLHFLFNMATGSGKTLIMAGLILYLYNEGYRNFLFFTRFDNIVKKTIDNFLNSESNKYLFDKEISIDNKKIAINQVSNFEDSDPNGINICFTTISKLHGDIYTEKENSITLEDFKKHKIILIADEAHNFQVATRQNTISPELEKPTWENTIQKIFELNKQNLLLEFTATLDWENKGVAEKYQDKVIYRYDLKQFRNDGFSKDPALFYTDTDRKTRMLQAIILSQYKQEVATKNGIQLKPVVLFKAQRTITDSQENKKLFHELIENLSVDDIKSVRSKTNVAILQKAFEFFKENKITDSVLVKKLQNGFAENKCLDANNDNEIENNQILLNSLEDANNQIRAIFAVQKLNEGWDVLNLFDIVRLYETRDGKNNIPGKTTIAEAQLVGRGARYYPFSLNENDEKYKRKFDNDRENELAILEQLHYHSHNESRYISEITKASVEQGLLDETERDVDFKLKEEFKTKQFYKSGIVWSNKRVKTDFEKKKVLENLPCRKTNITFKISSGIGSEEMVFGQSRQVLRGQFVPERKDIKLPQIEKHVVLKALQKSEFYNFSKISEFIPELKSIDELVESEKYLAGFAITLEGRKEDIDNLNNQIYFEAVLKLLNIIQQEIQSNTSEYEGTKEFEASSFKVVFGDKKVKVKIGSENENGRWDYVKDKDWYVFDSFYGTSEEKDFVDLVARMIDELREKYQEIYLVRNERVLKIFSFKDGSAFEPDYLLFMKDKKGKDLNYQLFIEPKGMHLAEYDKWKNEFLQEITEMNKTKMALEYKSKKYKILGVPFYNKAKENDFRDKFYEILN
ncbi:MAG: DEAD/DEAH box helicase family protein [Halobacteriovoraceae bacterium]|nr:DEAD/DEAH box helicase family protein [Halobacteriovoraceae bacterium]